MEGKWGSRLEGKVRKACKRLEISQQGAQGVTCGPWALVKRETGQAEEALTVRMPSFSGSPFSGIICGSD